jgi:hypothetical protein
MNDDVSTVGEEIARAATLTTAMDTLPPGTIFQYLGVECAAINYDVDDGDFMYQYADKNGEIQARLVDVYELPGFIKAISVTRKAK